MNNKTYYSVFSYYNNALTDEKLNVALLIFNDKDYSYNVNLRKLKMSRYFNRELYGKFKEDILSYHNHFKIFKPDLLYIQQLILRNTGLLHISNPVETLNSDGLYKKMIK